MVNIYTLKNYSFTIKRFKKLWKSKKSYVLNSLSYESIFKWVKVPSGTIIFSDLERLTPLELKTLKKLSRNLLKKIPNLIILNDPNYYLNRFDFLRQLYLKGINKFNCYLLEDYENTQINFPVFIRSLYDHKGAIGDLISNREALNYRIKEFKKEKNNFSEFIIIEYLDISEDYKYKKFSAMKIGKHIFPRHLLISKHWITKYPEIVTKESIDEEETFLKYFPKKKEIEEIFKIANIDYGRIDYGFINKQIQVWEINTNPVLIPDPTKIHRKRLKSQRKIAEILHKSFSDNSHFMEKNPSRKSKKYYSHQTIFLGFLVIMNNIFNVYNRRKFKIKV